jgi:hypothetical protein
LGLPSWPPLIALDAPLCPLIGGYNLRSLTTARDCLAAASYKDSSDHLLTRGMPGGYVNEFHHGLQLLMAMLMHQGLVGRAGPERRYNIGVTYLGEIVALLAKMSDIVPQGLPLFLPTALQIPGVTRPHVRTLEIAGKDLLEEFPAVDRVSRKVIEPGSRHVSQVDGEELNDE